MDILKDEAVRVYNKARRVIFVDGYKINPLEYVTIEKNAFQEMGKKFPRLTELVAIGDLQVLDEKENIEEIEKNDEMYLYCADYQEKHKTLDIDTTVGQYAATIRRNKRFEENDKKRQEEEKAKKMAMEQRLEKKQ